MIKILRLNWTTGHCYYSYVWPEYTRSNFPFTDSLGYTGYRIS